MFRNGWMCGPAGVAASVCADVSQISQEEAGLKRIHLLSSIGLYINSTLKKLKS